MTFQEMDKIKQVQLELMDEIHRICEKNSITYYMIAGTLLGAVRHKGFIPWDVDIDVAMPREEYERFKERCLVELNEQYRYCDHLSSKCYPRPHALVCDTRSRIYMKYDHLNPVTEKVGVYVDIFPLDNAPDDEYLRKRQAKKLINIRKFKQYRIPYSYSYKRWKRFAHYVVSTLLSWVPVRKVNEYQQRMMRKYGGQSTGCICSMASQYPYAKQCMPREVYGKPTLLAFEGRNYYAPERYDEYLSRLYGDYMQLPPEEKRKANLDVYSKVIFLDR